MPARVLRARATARSAVGSVSPGGSGSQSPPQRPSVAAQFTPSDSDVTAGGSGGGGLGRPGLHPPAPSLRRRGRRLPVPASAAAAPLPRTLRVAERLGDPSLGKRQGRRGKEVRDPGRRVKRQGLRRGDKAFLWLQVVARAALNKSSGSLSLSVPEMGLEDGNDGRGVPFRSKGETNRCPLTSLELCRPSEGTMGAGAVFLESHLE
ncbi:uncharacterized protein LOC117066200 [Trachypithecus francoisi]|uniref:uncharacterized protein LOC117066200 n=1 Tax=Trachypithecus francoisi TaxID=54180 RepID=UPI00141B2041|nr:uncharacterized protein LOC117066200 [Trachypithecus francoisi]